MQTTNVYYKEILDPIQKEKNRLEKDIRVLRYHLEQPDLDDKSRTDFEHDLAEAEKELGKLESKQ